ncbi:MAG TPA: class I SAM-dependent methyltransferase [Mycobacteriales bacterium]|jgi:SAM-dependent methyltransferase|nr:class I SAM-dependent methyltransferase [Mycobacteriales bacterium]
MSLPPDYFDRLYDEFEDPWGFATRWYERRKHALTLAVLPEARFGDALEVGCSIGVLTAGLAERCDRLVAIDPSAKALAAARTRAPGVDFRQGTVPGDWPAGTYDLVVLSEVGYYLDTDDLSALLDYTAADLAPDGFVVACHWRHPVADYPQTGDAVHEAMAERWPRQSRIEEADFLLDVLHPSGPYTVATRAGLVHPQD